MAGQPAVMPKDTPEHHFLRFRENGEREELARSLELVAGELMSVALHLARNREEACDLVQTTFVTAIESADRFDAKARLFPWLRGMLVNHERQRRRSRGRRRETETEEPGEAREPDPSETTHRKLLLENILDHVQRLPRTYREVVDLYVGQGWDSPKIASHLDRSPSTVRTQLFRGLEKLRNILPPGLAIGTIAYLAMRHGSEHVSSPPPKIASSTPRLLATGATLLAVTAATLFVVASWEEDPAPTPAAGPVATNQKQDPAPAVAPAQPVASNAPEARKPASDKGAVRVHLRWADTGQPAAGISIRLDANYVVGTAPVQASSTWQEGRSDANGVVVFESVPPGPACFFLSDGPRSSGNFVVSAGRTVEQRLSLSPQSQWQGIVTGPGGRPVADAEVWLSSSGARFSPGYVAAVTGPDGAFRVAHFAPRGALWARKLGYTVSAQSWMTAETLPVQVSLVLESDPCQVTGVVTDSAARPLQGAVVAVYPDDPLRGRRPTTYRVTRKDGAFAIRDLPRGRYAIVASHRGTAPALRDSLELTPDSPGKVTFQLVKGATVQGRVIHDWSQTDHRRFMVVGEPESKSGAPEMWTLLSSSSTVGKSGEYCLQGLLAGRVRLLLLDARNTREPRANQVLTVAAGTSHRWHISVEALLKIRGRIIDERGRPLARMEIQAVPNELAWHLGASVSTTSDSDGRFVLSGLKGRPYRLHVTDPNSKPGIPSLRKGPIFPGAGELDLVLVSASRPSASITGTLSARSVRHWRHVHIRMPDELETRFWNTPVAPDSRGFRFGPLPPGEFHIWGIQSLDESTPGCTLAVVHVEVGKSHDLGELDAGDLQPVSLQLSRADRRPVITGGELLILAESSALIRTVSSLRDGKAETKLFPGSYVLRAPGRNFWTSGTPFTVRAGFPNVLKVRVQAARPCHLRLPFKPHKTAALDAPLLLTILDSSDQVVHKDAALPQKGDDHPFYSFEVGLPKGEYRVEASPRWGGRVQHSFRVESVGDEPQLVEIPIK